MSTFKSLVLIVSAFLCLVATAFAATEVTSITANPDPFNPYESETTTITVEATPGVDTLELRVLTDDGYDVVRGGLTLTETSPGIYAVTWDGKDSSNALFLAGDYVLRVFNLATTTFIGPYAEITVEGLAHDAPVPFVPTGTNAVVFTYMGESGQTGLSLMFLKPHYPGMWWYDSSSHRKLPLVETSTPGTYTASWNPVYGVDQFIMPDDTYNIYIVDAAGNRSTTTGQITIQTISSVSASPAQFNPAGGEVSTITANGATGLDLDLKIVQHNSDGTRETINVLSMSEEQTGIYTAEWDGRDEAGDLTPVKSYYIEIWHTGSPAPYYQRWNGVQVSVGTSSITASPDPFNPTGTNTSVITVEAAPGQTDLSLRFYIYSTWWRGPEGTYSLPLTETSTPGVYTASWDAINYARKLIDGRNQWVPDYIMRDGTYTIYVYDSAGNRSTTTGQITISGVSSVSESPSPFIPGGNNFATITATAAAGLDLETRIFNQNTDTLTRVLPMTEASGTYTAEWDGKDTYGNFAGANTYMAKIYSTGSSIRHYPQRSFVVNVAVFAISALPDPFVPTGSNEATITVRADALQSGLTTSIAHPEGGTTPRLALREVGSEGTYVATWDGKIDGLIPKDGICTIRVYDSSGNEFPVTGTLTLSSKPIRSHRSKHCDHFSRNGTGTQPGSQDRQRKNYSLNRIRQRLFSLLGRQG